MSAQTELMKLASEVSDLESRVGSERERSIARFAKKAVQYLSDAQEEWRTVTSFFESRPTGMDGMKFEIWKDMGQDAMTVQRYISDALDGAKNTMYGLNTDE